MNKRLIILAGMIVVLATVALSKNTQPPEHENTEKVMQSEENVHLHAGFQVYVDNELQDFSDFKYMQFKSCAENGEHEHLTNEEEQIERAHLHDFVGDVVHVHRAQATWGDLFANINYEIEPEMVYMNGEFFEDGLLAYEIKPYDSVVVFQGENTEIEEKLESAVVREHIVEVESTSEYCGS